jgi:hypothetical protein
MDPNATYTMILEALAEGDNEGAKSAGLDLARWLRRNGFYPTGVDKGEVDRVVREVTDWHPLTIEGCDMEQCGTTTGELRVLPETGENNSIVCRSCYEGIMAYRRREFPNVVRYGIDPKWETLNVYIP